MTNSKIRRKIFLRNITKNDLSLIRDWRNSLGIREFNTQFILLDMKNQENWYNEIMKKSSNRKMFIIQDYLRNPIGICGLIHIDKKNKNASIAIMIGKSSFQGQGYGTISLKKLVNFGFQKLNLHRISAEVFEYNLSSIRIFEKLNFKHEATMRQYLWRDNKWWDVYLYSLLKKEFQTDALKPLKN